eukprot:764417-Hanusia_phi.AAC.4
MFMAISILQLSCPIVILFCLLCHSRRQPPTPYPYPLDSNLDEVGYTTLPGGSYKILGEQCGGCQYLLPIA